jgi:hypothetical protein
MVRASAAAVRVEVYNFPERFSGIKAARINIRNLEYFGTLKLFLKV